MKDNYWSMDDAVDDTDSGIYVIGTSEVVEGGLYIQLYSFTFNIYKRLIRKF